MLFSESELFECFNFKGLSHAYFQSWLLDSEKVCDSYYFKYEV